MSLRVFLGIDPGAAGGLGKIVVDDNGQRASAFSFNGLTEHDTFDLLKNVTPWPKNTFCLIERAQAFPGQGVSSSFNYGVGYGCLRMALIALSIPFETVTAGTWQRALGCLSKGKKNVTKKKAQELYPEIKCTHAVSDALLIATYCMRTRGGENGEPPPF